MKRKRAFCSFDVCLVFFFGFLWGEKVFLFLTTNPDIFFFSHPFSPPPLSANQKKGIFTLFLFWDHSQALLWETMQRNEAHLEFERKKKRGLGKERTRNKKEKRVC